MQPEVRLADSVTVLGIEHRGCVLVTGSHGGIVAAHYAARAGVRAAVFNDAGGGLDDAGVAGLAWLDRYAVPAAAVSHRDARIGDARRTLDSGGVSRSNAAAARLGVAFGQRCRDAVRRLADAAWNDADCEVERYAEGRYTLDAGQGVTGLDSIGQIRPVDIGRVLVIGSHCELHGGDPATALPIAARAALFHDAGYGAVDDACTRLPVLAARGIVAAAVAHTSARIGDARSMWESGRLSRVNQPATALGLRAGMAVRDAALSIVERRVR